MTWTRLSDDWCDKIETADPPLSLAARWHLLQLVQRCSRTQTWEGTLRLSAALRVSDVDDPTAALTELHDAGHIEVLDDTTVRVTHIEHHVLPPSQRPDAVRDRKRQSRARGETGGHSDGHADGHSDSPRDRHSDPGTGRGALTDSPPPPPTTHPTAAARIGRLLHRHTPEVGSTTAGTLRKRLASKERHHISAALDHATAAGWLHVDTDGRIRRGATPT